MEAPLDGSLMMEVDMYHLMLMALKAMMALCLRILPVLMPLMVLDKLLTLPVLNVEENIK